MLRRHAVSAVVFLLATLAIPAAALDDGDGAAIVVTIDGRPIVRRDFDAAARAARLDTLASSERLLQGRAALVERLVDERLLRLAIERGGIEVAAADVDAAVAEARKQAAAQGQPLAEFLARSGRDEAGFRAQAELELGAKKLVEPRVTAAALESFVESKRREFDGTLLRASHVLLRPDTGRGDEAIAACMQQAEQIRRRILAGELSFTAAAEAYSAAPSRHRGGDVGFLPRNSLANEEFARRVFSLAKGEISRPFPTPFGVHVVTVTAVEPGRGPTGDLAERLRPQFLVKLIRDMIAEQRALRTIEYAEGVAHFDPATPEGGPSPRRIIVAGPQTP
ncbi:MAG: peptidylprolyl isomerase [Planctomycetia bacterium]|jgi:parvulin-like peptidyl-prolyl isomerase